MKVGTDGVLLGSWANGGKTILDVGTGSGLIAMFMAQRNENAIVTAIDIDHDSFLQAKDNVRNSIYKDRITVLESSLQNFNVGEYQSIVCNPPFFNRSLKNKDERKVLARHTETLSYHDLFRHVAALLTDDGEFSAIIPSLCRSDFDEEAMFAGLFPSRICAVRTVRRKPVARYLLSYKKHPSSKIEEESVCLNNEDMTRTEWFQRLTSDFYL